MKKFFEDLFFFEKHLPLCPWPWPRAFLSLASRGSVLRKAVLGLGLGFFWCPSPWPRALCPRLHLCYIFLQLKLLNIVCKAKIICLQLRFKYCSRINCAKFYRQAIPGLYCPNLFKNVLGGKHLHMVTNYSIYQSLYHDQLRFVSLH